MHQCRRCRLTFPPDAFSPSRVRYGHWVCRDCSNTESMTRYAVNRAYIDAFKLAAGCADCGYNASPVALEFDHLPGSEKVGKVSNLASSRCLERVKEEIAKCEVVCSNCHAIRTADRRQSAVWWEEWRAAQAEGPTGVESGQLSLREVT